MRPLAGNPRSIPSPQCRYSSGRRTARPGLSIAPGIGQKGGIVHQHPGILRRLAYERQRDLSRRFRERDGDGLQPRWEHRFHVLDEALRAADEFTRREFQWSMRFNVEV